MPLRASRHRIPPILNHDIIQLTIHRKYCMICPLGITPNHPRDQYSISCLLSGPKALSETMSTFYEFRMLNLPARFGISNNGAKMLKAFEDFKTSRIDEAELGRLIRLSPNNRTALVDTLQRCIDVMSQTPEETKHCTAIMRQCTDMIGIAGRCSRLLCLPQTII
jgi:hypothetical protein